MKLMEYFLEFIEALRYQLLDDQERWGNEWKKRPIESNDDWEHQNVRIYDRFDAYLVDWLDKDIPIPWLKIAGLAFIAWVREYDPEGYSK